MSTTSKFTRYKKATPAAKTGINGTKFSNQNFSLLVSSGIHALDSLMGGGLPVGSLLLLEEDAGGYYAETFARCFLSEGIYCKQRLFVASQDTDIPALNLMGHVTTEYVNSANSYPTHKIENSQMLERTTCDDVVSKVTMKREKSMKELRYLIGHLPSITPENDRETNQSVQSSPEMQIAWRYENMKLADSSIGENTDFGHKLDLSRSIPSEITDDADIIIWPKTNPSPTSSENFMNDLVDCLKDDRHLMDDNNQGKQVLRVAALRLGSPLWEEEDLAKILCSLRSWLRQSIAVGFVTVPSYLFQNPSTIDHLIHFSDMAIRLDSFAGTVHASNPVFKDYHGLVHIRKIAAFNSLVPHQPLTDLAFKLRRRKINIERFCLPPELEDTTARGEDRGSLSCASTKSKTLDF